MEIIGTVYIINRLIKPITVVFNDIYIGISG